MRLASYLIILSLLRSTPAFGAVFSVGSSPGYPSISAAFSAVAISSSSIAASETITVSINSGVYTESAQAPTIPQPLVIAAVTGETVVLSATGQAYGISVSGVANVTIQ